MGMFSSLVEMVGSGFGNADSTQAKLAQAVLSRISPTTAPA
jgi:hypothetical protein